MTFNILDYQNLLKDKNCTRIMWTKVRIDASSNISSKVLRNLKSLSKWIQQLV